MSQPNSEPRLNKRLYTDITRLKLLDKPDAEVRFRLEKSPFTGDEDEDELLEKKREDYLIIGQIFPISEIFCERCYSIEIKLTKSFPGDPPEVRFLTPMYHPNVGKDGKFCNELLLKNFNWTMHTSLVQVIKAVVDHIDHPNVQFSVSLEIGKEYVENPAEFKKHALEYVHKHGLPR